jgi:hypothetical protein
VYKIGFTGTQSGMTSAQKLMFDAIMFTANEHNAMEFHHGDCVGSDKEAHEAVLLLSKHLKCTVKTIIHPPTIKTKRAFCHSDESREPLPYLDRNQKIVDATDVLIATPAEKKEKLRSGTWATVRRARKQGKPIFIINPDGTLIEESMETHSDNSKTKKKGKKK